MGFDDVIEMEDSSDLDLQGTRMLHAVFTLSYGTGTANMPATFHDPSSTGVSSFRQQKLEREAKKN